MSSILDADANQLAEFILLNTVIVIMQLWYNKNYIPNIKRE